MLSQYSTRKRIDEGLTIANVIIDQIDLGNETVKLD